MPYIHIRMIFRKIFFFASMLILSVLSHPWLFSLHWDNSIKILSMDIIKSAEGINKVIITEKPNAAAESSQSQKNVNNLKTLAENGHLYMVPQAPPAPNPDPVEYVKELGKRGATFYIGPHKYSTDEAIELVQKSKEATIDVSKYPEVHLGGC